MPVKTYWCSSPLGSKYAAKNRKGDVQMKKLLKAFGMAILEACNVYAQAYRC